MTEFGGTAHVLLSPEAGRGSAAAVGAAVIDRLEALGADLVDVTAADAASSAAAVRAAVAEGAERIVVVGGDGIVHLALQEIAGTEVVLGVVPVGTGNDFVRALDGLPDDPLAAAATALGPAAPVDAIRVGDRWVASVATAGFSGDVNERANRLRRPRGPSRYTVATLLELPQLQRRPVELTVDGVTHRHDAALLAVANTAWFGGGMQICPAAEPDDGLLDVTVVADIGRLELLRFFRLVFAGRHLDHPDVHTHRGTTVEVRADDLTLWGDGEPLDPAPATLTAVPSAFRLAHDPGAAPS